MNLKHGLSRSPEYGAWRSMRRRCSVPGTMSWHRYGGRGIRVCERWRKFENFIADVGRRPSPLHSIDRYPNRDGDYKPGNVRWATAKQQQINRDATKWVNCFGVLYVDIARANGINEYTFRARIRIGIPPLDAASKPAKFKRKPLSRAERRTVFALHRCGFTQIIIAERMRTSQSAISDILKKARQ